MNPKDTAVATLAHIEMHPEEWVQGAWRCETGMCFAGHYAVLAGKEFVTDDHDNDHYLDLKDDEGPVEVSHWVREDLGIDLSDATALFAGNNRIEDLRAGVKAYLNDEPIRPAVKAVARELDGDWDEDVV